MLSDIEIDSHLAALHLPSAGNEYVPRHDNECLLRICKLAQGPIRRTCRRHARLAQAGDLANVL